MSTWIDYRVLREKLDFQSVLQHYGINAKLKGDRAYCYCPLPRHPIRSDGKPRTESLSINLEKRLFHCFGCKIGGNVLEFAVRMEGFDPTDSGQLRKAAIKIAQVFGITMNNPAKVNGNVEKGKFASSIPRPGLADSSLNDSSKLDQPRQINPAIDFQLKHLDPDHPYLRDRGFTPETIRHFGLGYCSKGLMKNRIAIPLHNLVGQLIGYAGRLADEKMISGESPRYLFPGEREKGGVVIEFRKSELLYNLHRLPEKLKELIIVEGFASVWWLHQHGYPNVVATMGSSLSSYQQQMIQEFLHHDGKLWILPDRDEAGERMAQQILLAISPSHWCRWVRLQQGQQPTDLSGDELEAVLKSC